VTAEGLLIQDFLTQSKNELIIDVRAPIEFFKGHIPGATNIPLFENSKEKKLEHYINNKEKKLRLHVV
jgi:rhodanese-related sulfurtransferase